METSSVCPICKKRIQAQIKKEGNEWFILKTCEEHGFFKDKYWEEEECKFLDRTRDGNCPNNCGLCNNHLSKTVMGLIDVTDKCNLNCPYCFANSGKGKTDPTRQEIINMLWKLKETGCIAVQYTGGEPLIREDIVELVSLAKDIGFTHMQIATNGVGLAEKQELAKELKDAGLNTLYVKFNGITKKTNELLEYWDDILKNCRKANLHITLVPTVIKGFNDNELGSIVKFALNNSDIIRGVNFQPISFVGRKKYNPNERITTPQVIQRLSEQVECLTPDCFYDIRSVRPLSRLAEKFGKKNVVDFTAHPVCGAATYLLNGKKGIVPITTVIEVDKFFEIITELANSKMGLFDVIKGINNVRKVIHEEYLPENVNLSKLFTTFLRTGAYSDLGKLHKKILLIGIMHFQDCYNMDLERLKRCVIHQVTPDLKLIPFCAYNNFYRGT